MAMTTDVLIQKMDQNPGRWIIVRPSKVPSGLTPVTHYFASSKRGGMVIRHKYIKEDGTHSSIEGMSGPQMRLLWKNKAWSLVGTEDA